MYFPSSSRQFFFGDLKYFIHCTLHYFIYIIFILLSKYTSNSNILFCNTWKQRDLEQIIQKLSNHLTQCNIFFQFKCNSGTCNSVHTMNRGDNRLHCFPCDFSMCSNCAMRNVATTELWTGFIFSTKWYSWNTCLICFFCASNDSVYRGRIDRGVLSCFMFFDCQCH